MFPRSGGVYVYVREGFGRLPAFLFGWSELLLIRASALGAIATPFAEYLLRSLGLDPTRPPYDAAVHWVAAVAIVLTATLNYVGVRWSALILNFTTAAKYGALALLVLLAFGVGQGSFGHFAEAGGPVQGGLFGLALVSVMWAYDGWGDLSFVGGEVKDPERSLPRALIVGTGAVVAIYLFVNAAYLYLIPIGAMACFRFSARAAAAVFVLRRRRPPAVLPRAVRVLGYPVVPALFVLATLYMLGNALWQDPLHTGVAFLIILAGVPVYHVWLRPSRG